MATPLTRYMQDGAAIDYTPGSAVVAGDVVVQNELVGIAKQDIAANALGALHLEGVFRVPKTGGSAGETHAVGQNLYWDATNQVATTTASTHKLMGKCTRARAATDTDTDVKLNQ